MPPERSRAPAAAAEPWQLTDAVLTQLDAALLDHPPERGAALLGPAGHRLITHVLPDPEPGGPSSYRHSAVLQTALTAVLGRRGDLAYRGTVHSHPGAMAEPSLQDEVAFRAVLEENPALAQGLLFPIAVSVPISSLTEVAEGWGTEHLFALPGGSVAMYAVSNGADHVDVLPVATTVLPVHAIATAICRNLPWTPCDAGTVRELTTGAVWLRQLLVPADGSGSGGESRRDVSVLISPGYPWVAPMFSVDRQPFWSPSWDLAATLDRRLADAAAVLHEQCAVSLLLRGTRRDG